MPNDPAKPHYIVKPAREKFSFDVEGAIAFFGGFASFQEQLLANGMDAPTYNNFRGWRNRRAMSSDLIARMVRLANILNVDFDLNNYIVNPISMTSTLPPAAIQSNDPTTDPDYDGNERFSPSTPPAPAPAAARPEPAVPAVPANPRGMRRSSDV